ncbi:MAG: endonuclease/exonuclease/phosphatase family protein, partial [Dehalococcoidia bacterium]
PAAVSGDGYPVRLMTYNLHNGFNAEGYLNMEDLALVIEEADVDIIALQEVSRGWVISGRLDMLSWLSQRLEMPYVFGPTADPFWGNAIISRYPIVEYSNYDLPPRDLPVLRGFTEAVIDLGDGDYIRVIATHFHHVEEDTDVRLQQAQRILEGWGSTCCTVLLGDLNADPHEPEMVMLREAGLVDTVVPLEPPKLYTWHANDLHRRIDYIWITPDMTASDVSVIFTKASDHLPVVAEVDRKVP